MAVKPCSRIRRPLSSRPRYRSRSAGVLGGFQNVPVPVFSLELLPLRPFSAAPYHLGVNEAGGTYKHVYRSLYGSLNRPQDACTDRPAYEHPREDPYLKAHRKRYASPPTPESQANATLHMHSRP